MYENIIAERLTSLRLKKGVSARDMSLTIGQSAGYINSIENKLSLPSMNAFFYICEFFEITPKEFFDDATRNPKLINDIINELRRLDDEQLGHILGIVKSI